MAAWPFTCEWLQELRCSWSGMWQGCRPPCALSWWVTRTGVCLGCSPNLLGKCRMCNRQHSSLLCLPFFCRFLLKSEWEREKTAMKLCQLGNLSVIEFVSKVLNLSFGVRLLVQLVIFHQIYMDNAMSKCSWYNGIMKSDWQCNEHKNHKKPPAVYGVVKWNFKAILKMKQK